MVSNSEVLLRKQFDPFTECYSFRWHFIEQLLISIGYSVKVVKCFTRVFTYFKYDKALLQVHFKWISLVLWVWCST